MRPHGKYASVNPQNPEAFAQCDRCSFWYNRTDLQWQAGWAGQQLFNLQILVCDRCLDIPNEQLRTIILPPDPLPVLNARVPNFAYEEQTVRITQYSGPVPKPSPWGAGPQMIRCLQDGTIPRILEFNTSS